VADRNRIESIGLATLVMRFGSSMQRAWC